MHTLDRPAEPFVLSICCDAQLARTRLAILRIRFKAETVCGPEALQEFGECAVLVVILCYTLSAAACEQAEREARRLWPAAKLIGLQSRLGTCSAAAPDAFVSSAAGPDGLLAAVANLAGGAD